MPPSARNVRYTRHQSLEAVTRAELRRAGQAACVELKPFVAAGVAAQTLTAQGWTVSEVGNWSGPAVQEGTVYYRSGAEAQARRVALDLGLSTVRASEEWSAQVTVVLTHG